MRTMAITICLLILGSLGLPRSTLGVTMSTITVTAYHYCPGSKGITASGKRVEVGMVAVSRDLERDLSLKFGDRLMLQGLGEYEFQDRMATRWCKKADIYMDCQTKAIRFGVKRYIVLVKLV